MQRHLCEREIIEKQPSRNKVIKVIKLRSLSHRVAIIKHQAIEEHQAAAIEKRLLRSEVIEKQPSRSGHREVRPSKSGHWEARSSRLLSCGHQVMEQRSSSIRPSKNIEQRPSGIRYQAAKPSKSSRQREKSLSSNQETVVSRKT